MLIAFIFSKETKNTTALIKRLGEIVEESDNQAPSITTTEKIYKYEEEVPFEIHRENNIWVLTGPKIEELFKMTRFTEDESVMHFAYKLKKMGVDITFHCDFRRYYFMKEIAEFCDIPLLEENSLLKI